VTTFRLLSVQFNYLPNHNNSVIWQNMESVAKSRFPGWGKILYLSFFLVSWGGVGWDWVHWVRRPLTGLLYQPRTIDDECGAVGGMRIGRGNWSIRRKPVPVPFCPPNIPHDLTWARTRAPAVGSRRLTAWAMAWPFLCLGHRIQTGFGTTQSLIIQGRRAT
jgi:hypothetical protein